MGREEGRGRDSHAFSRHGRGLSDPPLQVLPNPPNLPPDIRRTQAPRMLTAASLYSRPEHWDHRELSYAFPTEKGSDSDDCWLYAKSQVKPYAEQQNDAPTCLPPSPLLPAYLTPIPQVMEIKSKGRIPTAW